MEEVLEDLYIRAQSKGYGKTMDDFTTLIYSNDDVLEDMYGYVQSKGYAKTKEDFENLIGKKKDFREPASDSPSGDGSLEQPVDKVASQLQRIKDKEELTGVTPELLEKGESFIVPQLNYLYGEQGFTFDEADILGKEIKVTAANGQSKKIPLGLLRDKEAREQELKDFIIDNREESINIRKKQIGYNANKIKFESDEAFAKTNKNFAAEAKQLQDGYDLFVKNSDRLEEEIAAVEAMSDVQLMNNKQFVDDLNQRIKDHNQARINLENSTNLFNQKEKELNLATGEYFSMKEQQGSLGRLAIKKFISSFTRMSSEYAQTTVDALNFFPLELQMGEGPYKSEMLKYGQEFGFGVPSNAENLSIKEIQEFYNKPSDQERMVTAPFAKEKVTEKISAIEVINKKIEDDNRKQNAPLTDIIREDVLEKWTNKSVSEQYEAAKTEGFWGGALYGLAESLPALLTPSFPQRMANLYTLTSSFVDEEMAKNPMFDDIPESEKATLKSVIAIPSAFLENLGFRNVINQRGLITNILKRALDKTPNNAGPSTFKEFIRQEALSPATKAALTVTGAAAAEFETGALQQVTEDVVKIIYNDMKDKGLFETPETATEFILDVLYSGAQEAVGGFILGVPNAVSNAYAGNNFNTLTPQQLAAFKIIKNDPNISQTAFTNKLKAQINQGTLTPEQAKQVKADYELAIALASQIPDNISDTEFASVMNKLVRRKKLQDATENKDPNLVKNDLEEIQQINAELAKVNERPVQKETTEETLDEVFAEPEPSEKLDATQTFFTETTEGVETVSDNLVINNISAPETTSKIVSTITDIATKAANAISSVLPTTRIVLHQSNAEFEKYAPAGRGFFDPDSNIIHVNLEKATNTTVPHEVFHALVVNKMSDPQTAKLADSMMRSVRKALPKGSALAKRIDDFAALYNDQPDFQNDERMAELFGIMSAEYTQLTKPQKNK
ncbi:MAG: hypothetical protein CMI74_03935, partial [Candidatus Pelagibacter sp.]|nr:hypothetical protein [Candidatus Pelagibacter sp.]